MPFPVIISAPLSPPLLIQGVKTRLVPFIFSSIRWRKKGVWYEGFFGTGAVLINAIYYGKVRCSVVTDINPYFIKFYKDIQSNKLDLSKLKKFMITHALRMGKIGKPYYYELRDRFNSNPNSRLLLFLNLSCFRQVLRFNSKGKLTSSFGNRGLYGSKGVRFRIINSYLMRIKFISSLFKFCKVRFLNNDFRIIFDLINEKDIVYFDPPYLGRRLDYYGRKFSLEDWKDLIEFSRYTSAHVCLSNLYSDYSGLNKNIVPLKQENYFKIRRIKYRYNLSIDTDKSNVVECILLNKKTLAHSSDLPNLSQYFKSSSAKSGF